MDPVSLPGRTLEHGPGRFLQAFRVRRTRPASAVDAENLAATVRSNTDGDNDGLGEDAVGG